MFLGDANHYLKIRNLLIMTWQRNWLVGHEIQYIVKYATKLGPIKPKPFIIYLFFCGKNKT